MKERVWTIGETSRMRSRRKRRSGDIARGCVDSRSGPITKPIFLSSAFVPNRGSV
jgi:hypothetical protein